MGVFSRFTDIVNANINSALDKAEDPEKIVRLIITEMEETLVEIRANTAGYLADKKSLERKADKLNASATQWNEKAELALSKEREDLARAALAEKQKLDGDIAQVTADIAKIEEILTTLQQDSARLNEKLSDAKAKQNAMNLRQQSAVTRLKVRQQTHCDDIDKAIMRFESFEGKIDALEAQVEAYDHVGQPSAQLLSHEFEKMEAQSKIDDALADLKAKMAANVAANDDTEQVEPAKAAKPAKSTKKVANG